jgi:hypothetical protein
MLEISAQVVGQADARYADALRLEASHLLEGGRLAQALAVAQRGWELYGDTPENRSRRGSLLRTRAEIEWLQGNAGAARDDALAARPLLASIADVPALLALDGIAVLACARAPAQACPADLESAFATKLQAAATNTHPRMLLARLAFARRELERGNAASARVTIESAITSADSELDNHPLLRSAQVWRAVVLDAEQRCADALPARAQAARATSFDDYPWLVEANAALARAHNCVPP